MGEVIVTIRLMPESVDVDLKRLEAEVRSRIQVHSIEREPIAFGLEALRVITIIPDSAGGTDPLEKALAKIAGVASVQVIDIRRAL
jgi:elongation factor 1-beta